MTKNSTKLEYNKHSVKWVSEVPPEFVVNTEDEINTKEFIGDTEEVDTKPEYMHYAEDFMTKNLSKEEFIKIHDLVIEHSSQYGKQFINQKT